MKIKPKYGKILVISAILFLLIIVTACSGRTGSPGLFGRKSSEQGDTPFTTKVHTGLYGLTMKFLRNEPPRVVYYTGSPVPFDIMFEMRNRGATDITKGYLYLSGYDRNIIEPSIVSPSGRNLPMFFTLGGVSNFNPEGDYTTIEFENTIRNWPPGTDSYEPLFRASACYQYETVANPVVCIDPHPFSSLEEKKPCRVRNVPLGGGQGAPIQVTSVEEEATEDYVYFKIHIQNSQAKGVVYDKQKVDPSYPDSCPFNIQYKDINKVHYIPPTFIGDGSSNPTLVECKPDSPVRLIDNQAIIYCKYSVPKTASGAYQSPLNIILDYGYLDYEEQRVTIKNAAG